MKKNILSVKTASALSALLLLTGCGFAALKADATDTSDAENLTLTNVSYHYVGASGIRLFQRNGYCACNADGGISYTFSGKSYPGKKYKNSRKVSICIRKRQVQK